MSDFDPAAYAAQASAILGLKLQEAHRPGVLMNLVLARRMAALVESVALTPRDEPAPVYVAGRPG